MGVEEMVAMFLHIIAHDVNIRVIKRQFVRSEETISRRFNDVLLAILRCHNLLLKKPQPFSQDKMDERWKWIKDCLGALDGTHIKVNVLEADKPRYRNRKAADSRVLRDALFRNGFSVPQGHYYLCDAGYMNCEGFLAPYRGQKYHLKDQNILGVDGETIHHIETSDAWGRWRDQLAQEMWNQWRKRHHAQ
ncbi:putative nuclease [Arachis hypogaea]|nr:putative nuclease [Arachis hypogaea]